MQQSYILYLKWNFRDTILDASNLTESSYLTEASNLTERSNLTENSKINKRSNLTENSNLSKLTKTFQSQFTPSIETLFFF